MNKYAMMMHKIVHNYNLILFIKITNLYQEKNVNNLAAISTTSMEIHYINAQLKKAVQSKLILLVS